MPKLVATKPFRYASRTLRPGDEFEASERDANLLKRVRRAEDYVEPEAQRDMQRDALRLRAEALGIEIDGRWGVPRLEQEIADAERKPPEPAAPEPTPPAQPDRGAPTYQRRDMTAEES